MPIRPQACVGPHFRQCLSDLGISSFALRFAAQLRCFRKCSLTSPMPRVCRQQIQYIFWLSEQWTSVQQRTSRPCNRAGCSNPTQQYLCRRHSWVRFTIRLGLSRQKGSFPVCSAQSSRHHRGSTKVERLQTSELDVAFSQALKIAETSARAAQYVATSCQNAIYY